MPGYYINKGDIKPIPEKMKYTIDRRTALHNHVMYGFCDEYYMKNGFEKFDHKCLYNANIVVFHRTFAIGDILMSVPVLRQMKKYYNIRRVILEYGDTKHNIEPELFPDLECVHEYKGNYDYYIDGENGLLEQDHNLTLGLTEVPRIALYQRFLGLPEITDLDYSFTEDKSRMLFNPDKEKIVYVSLYSSTKIRKLAQSFVPYIARYLNFLGLKPLFVDDIPHLDGVDAIYAHGKTNVQQAITNMKYCKLCITVDTGSLWFSHFANIPTIVIAGPTPKEVKMTYHPMKKYGKAFGIEMRKYCGCNRNCGGTAEYCSRTAPCFNEFCYGTVLDEIATLIDKIMKVEN